jgi:hypothetical protein
MYKMKGLRINMVSLAGLIAAIVLIAVLSGCSKCGYRCGQPNTWPNGSLEMGIFPTCPKKTCCPKTYDPCYPFVKSGSSVAQTENWGYESSSDTNDYLSGNGTQVSDTKYY